MWRRLLLLMGIVACFLVILFVVLTFIIFTPAESYGSDEPVFFRASPPKPPELAFTYTIHRRAPLEVARIFGRANGCAEANADLITAVAREAVYAGVDPRVFAALVAIESGCNQYAVSNRGAIGYTQVVPRVWKINYDFAGQYNLFNEDDNLRVGATILADLVAEHGLTEGIHRYNGTGVGCATCDPTYTYRILALSGRR